MTKRKSSATPLEALTELVEVLGSQAAAARHLGVGRQHLSDILSGRRGISGSVAKALGFRKRVVFEPIGKG
jgi:plasmid maintenance system antidote protein VapI